MKCVKMIGTKRFILSLYQTDTDKYQIVLEQGDTKHTSENLSDFRIASILFDMKLQELEGN